MNHRSIGAATLGAAVLLFALATGVTGRAQQTATPGATPTDVVCDVTPRTGDDLAVLAERAATPPIDADTPAVGEDDLVTGISVDGATREAIEATLARITACESAGDLPRLLALYTDDYVVRAVLPTEPVAIVPGTPTAPPATGTPEAVSNVRALVDAVALADGRVVATVDRAGRLELVIFVQDGDIWLVDDLRSLAGDDATPAANGTDDLLALPPVQAAVAAAAESAGIPSADVMVISVEPIVWPDSSLGCPEPDQFYAQAEVPGFAVSLRFGATDVTYHTDESDTVIPCELADQA